LAIGLLVLAVLLCPTAAEAPACCAVGRSGEPVVNADQSVIIIWDAETKTQHFIRRASFASKAEDFGFLIPSPTAPELSESGNEAFPVLQKLTEPEIIRRAAPSTGVGCGASKGAFSTVSTAIGGGGSVEVLSEKVVAGFKASVLKSTSAGALTEWLAEHGYDFSPAVEAWAEPYIRDGWKITALKVAADAGSATKKDVTAAALRLSFRTDRPLFPYREPDSKRDADSLSRRDRLLRIYFIADGRYRGELTKEVPWTGRTVWSNKLTAADRNVILGLLKLHENTGPAAWWLTEFEDKWPYRVAPADVYFARDKNQGSMKRPPIIIYASASWPTDVTTYAIAAAIVAPAFLTRLRRRG
jgi:hypothetical protein